MTPFRFKQILLLTAIILVLQLIHYIFRGRQRNFKLDAFTELTENLDQNAEQNDPKILKYVLANHLNPPTFGSYNLVSNTVSSRTNYSKTIPALVHKLLQNKKNGFFIEYGANDGLFLSNTLHLELEYGWNGLLLEPDPRLFSILKTRNRRAWLSDVCISTNRLPNTVVMMLNDENRTLGNARSIEVPCFSIFSILSALNVSTVDYFSLDIGGAELAIIKTIPFSQLKIRIFSVMFEEDNSEIELETYMKSVGYTLHSIISEKNKFILDKIFVDKYILTTN